METVLVTGGSGYLGGWCLVELLRRGYRVRTTVRIFRGSRRCAPGSSPRSMPATASRCWPRTCAPTRAGSRRSGVRLRPPRRLAVSAGAAEGSRRADRSGAGGDAASAAGRPRRGRRAASSSPPRSPRSAAAPSRFSAAHRGGLDRPRQSQADPLYPLEDDRRAGGVGLREERGEVEKLAVVNPGAILGPVLSEIVPTRSS